MSAMILRNAMRVSGALLLAFVLCLLLPVLTRADNTPSDIRDSSCQPEILAAVRLGYMSLDGSSFRPDGKIKGRDFLAAIKRGIEKSDVPPAQCSIENPNSYISRQQAIKMLVSSLYTREQIETIGKQCGGPELYLCDYADAGDIASWAKPYVAVAVYEGWVPERALLHPKDDATREFAAVLLARAFPDQGAFTGLVVYVSDPSYRRAMSVQIVSEDAGSAAIYPTATAMPSISFSSAPGVVSYSANLPDAMTRRVGPNPLLVSAVRVQRGKGGRLQVVLPASEAAKVIEANKQGLFLETWRVAILAGTAPSVQAALRAQTPP